MPSTSPEGAPQTDTSRAGASTGAHDGAAGQRSIDLGLNGEFRRAATLDGWLELEPPHPARSVGLLVEGLAELDAERGVSPRSGAALHAAYKAATHAMCLGVPGPGLRVPMKGAQRSRRVASRR